MLSDNYLICFPYYPYRIVVCQPNPADIPAPVHTIEEQGSKVMDTRKYYTNIDIELESWCSKVFFIDLWETLQILKTFD